MAAGDGDNSLTIGLIKINIYFLNILMVVLFRLTTINDDKSDFEMV